jgi:hypothetical protein
MFTPRELAAAYKNFIQSGPQYLDAETGIKAKVYRYGERVLFVYEEAETDLVILVHPTWQLCSPDVPERGSLRSLASRILHNAEHMAYGHQLRLRSW